MSKLIHFIAIIDLFSRYIIAHELASTLDMGFCLEALQRSLKLGCPLIFNTDQGSQFTSESFIKMLHYHHIQISMDHKGRCFDNIFVERLWRTLKQEAIYYYRPETVRELETCLKDFVQWYNTQRLHQALNYQTPETMYGKGKC